MPVRRAAQRARPRRGFIVTANQAGRPARTTRTTSPTRWDLRLPQPADPRPARRRTRRRSTVDDMADDPARHLQPDRARCWCPTCSTSTCRRGYYADGQRLLRDWDFTQPADSRGGGVLQRGLAQLLGSPSTTSCPSGSGPTAATAGSRWCATCCASRTTSGGTTSTPTTSWRPRRHPRPGDARRPRRADPPAARRDPDEWTWGHLHHARPARTRPSGERHRRGRGAVQPRRRCEVGGGSVGRRRDRLGRRRGVRASTSCRRCGWWSTSTTSTARAGST